MLVLGKIAQEAYERAKETFVSKDKQGIKVIDNVEKAEWTTIEESFSEDVNTLWDIITRVVFRGFGLIPVNENPIGQSPDYVGSQLRQSELVRPLAETIASNINAKLKDFLGESVFAFDMFPEFGPKELTTLVKGAIITPNEAREGLGFSPIEGGESLIISSATGTTTAQDLGDDEKKPDGDETGSEDDLTEEELEEDDAKSSSSS